MNDEIGAIVPFHKFYDALENFLDHSHSSVIIRAYDNSFINPEKKENDVFAINVLKTLCIGVRTKYRKYYQLDDF